MHLAAKILSEVETSADRSNQHELHAGLLRKALAFPTDPVSGRLEIIYLSQDSDESGGEECDFTLYNAREGKPRHPEYHLYYGSQLLQERARAGDTLIVVRPNESADLKALIVPKESALGRTVAAVLKEEGVEFGARFTRIRAVIREEALEHLIADSAEPGVVPDSELVVAAMDKDFLASALLGRRMPGTKEMAAEAERVLAEIFPGAITPDDQLHWLLEVETALFQNIEKQIGQQGLDALISDGKVPFDAAVTLIMSRLQSRKSRRGQSLQNHFAAVLRREGVPFDSQCTTEGKEKPDFVIPGSQQYQDPDFPSERLRMVACKSVVRERWRQVLKEAAKIPQKYLLSLDSGFTDDTLVAMTDASVYPFLPAHTIDEHYHGRAGRKYLGNVGGLIDLLKAATT